MKLPISLPSFGKKQQDKNYYLILLLRDEKTTAVILEEENKIVRVAGINEVPLLTPLEDITDDALLDILDKTISKAEETLPPSIQTEMTVFGVKDSWVEDKKIKKEFLDRLKNVGKALSLKPIGFLVISEAIAHLIQKEEGVPVSAIVAEIGKYSVMLSLFRGGRLLETKTAPVENSLPETVDALLKHFTSVEVLPSRILLLNAGDDETLSQSFITYQWSKSLPFLHMPQISVLSTNFDARAAVQGAANQMDFSVAESAFALSSAITPLTTPIEPTKENADEVQGEEVHTKKHHKEKPEEEIAGDDLASAIEQQHKGAEETPVMTPVGAALPENFGFVQGKDIADLPVPPTAKAHTINHDNFEPASFSSDEPYAPSVSPVDSSDSFEEQITASRLSRSDKGNMFAGVLSTLTAVPAKVVDAVKNTPLSTISLAGKSKLIMIVVLVLLVVIGIPTAYAYMAHADVTLVIKAKSFDDVEQVAFAVDGNNDFGSNTVKATTVSVTLDDKQSVPASGKKLIGDKAKGTVTLYNNNDAKKSLPAGTVISSSNGLDFTLDKDVSISSASGDAFSGTKPGTAQAAVTAKVLGTDSNLPSNTKFSVAGSSAVVAKNDSAFSGGTQKNVTVVASADRDKLLLQIPKNLESKAKDELAKKLSANEELLPLDMETTIDKKEFDKNIGDEATTVTASVTVTFNGIAYSKTDLQDFAKSVIEQKASTDANTPGNTIDTGISDLESNKDATYDARVTIKTGLLPKIDTAKVQQDITGKSVSSATTILMKLPQVESIQTKVSPPIPGLASFLPRVASHIKILTSSHE